MQESFESQSTWLARVDPVLIKRSIISRDVVWFFVNGRPILVTGTVNILLLGRLDRFHSAAAPENLVGQCLSLWWQRPHLGQRIGYNLRHVLNLRPNSMKRVSRPAGKDTFLTHWHTHHPALPRPSESLVAKERLTAAIGRLPVSWCVIRNHYQAQKRACLVRDTCNCDWCEKCPPSLDKLNVTLFISSRVENEVNLTPGFCQLLELKESSLCPS